MRSVFKLIILVFFLSSCGGSDNNPTMTFQASVNRYMEEYKIPGVVAGIWIPGKSPIVIEQGLSNIDSSQPVERGDHARIASITKSFTTTVVLQLAQEGQVDLQKPVHFYLPDLIIQNNDATVFELATMRSGIFDYTGDEAFITNFFEDPLKQVTDNYLLEVANRHSPYCVPGTGWRYSNTNTVILGLLIEKITGKTVAEEITTRIIRPLGLNQTSYPQSPDMPVPFMSGYFGSAENVTLINPSYTGASGAMVSALDDLRAWAVALGTGSLLSAETQHLRLQSLIPTDYSPVFDANFLCGPNNFPEYDKYGFGLGQINGWIGHTGDYLGYQSLVMYSPKNQAVVVILINQSFQGMHIPTTMFREWAQRPGLPHQKLFTFNELRRHL